VDIKKNTNFQDFMDAVEAEARAEGPESVAQLEAFGDYFKNCTRNISRQWVVYMLLCNDNSLYTGVTNNINKRVDTHMNRKGSKYVATRLPFLVVYEEPATNRSTAQKREAQIKKLSRQEKLKLVAKHLIRLEKIK
jgi:putative endonuclease